MPDLAYSLAGGGNANFDSVDVSGNTDVGGVVTAAGGVVGNLTGNVAGNLTGLVDGVDIDTKAPLASPTFTGTINAAAANFTGQLGSAGAFSLSNLFTATGITPAQVTANQTNYAPTTTGLFLLVSSNAAYTFDGLNGSSGQLRIWVNINTNVAFTHTFIHEGSGTNKFACPLAANYVLGAGQGVIVWYDPGISRFRIVPMT